MTFKIDAIKLSKEIGATKAAKELDIPQSTLDTWIVKHNKGDYDNVSITPQKALSLADENKRLTQEVRELKRVNKILKDASAFFAASQKK
jgi:transposase